MSPTQAPADDREPLGFGLVGYGFMGKAHSNALRTIPYIFWPSRLRPELVAIAGRTEEKVREAATRYGYALYTTDWRDLIEDERVQVLDNVTPDAMHVEPLLAAIARGKHVVCEKPLAPDPADARLLYEAADAAGVKHLVCFNYRYFPAVQLARELLQSGELGELHQARFRYSQEWRNDPELVPGTAAGVVDIICSHAIDQARLLCGEIESVSASISSVNPRRTWTGGEASTDDTVAFVAELEGGLVATVDASLAAPGRKNHLAWEINGAKGSLAWNLERPNELQVYRSGGRTAGFSEVIVTEADHPLVAPWWPSAHVLGWEHGHVNMLAHFVDAVAGGSAIEPVGATFYDGLRVAQVTAAVRASAERGERVAVEGGQR